MAIEQQSFSVPRLQRPKIVSKRVMIGPMNLCYSPIELVAVDRASPQGAMPVRP